MATSCENMASNSERIMEKSRNFQIAYVGCTNLCKHCTTDHARGIMKLPRDFPATTLSHCRAVTSAWSGNDQLCLESAAPTGVKQARRKQSRCGRHSLSNILKLQAMFLYSIHHQRAGKTNLFHMKGSRFHAFNNWCTFNIAKGLSAMEVRNNPITIHQASQCQAL